MRANKSVIGSSIVGLLMFGSPVLDVPNVSGIRLGQTNPDFSFKISILADAVKKDEEGAEPEAEAG